MIVHPGEQPVDGLLRRVETIVPEAESAVGKECAHVALVFCLNERAAGIGELIALNVTEVEAEHDGVGVMLVNDLLHGKVRLLDKLPLRASVERADTQLVAHHTGVERVRRARIAHEHKIEVVLLAILLPSKVALRRVRHERERHRRIQHHDERQNADDLRYRFKNSHR